MEGLFKYATFFDQELVKLSFPSTPSNLYDPLTYFLSLGGKRIRPLLTLLTAELMGSTKENAFHAAISIEYFHNFSLIHDDIMDNAPLRRNNPTVHTKWNSNTAILSGDVLLVKAYSSLGFYTDSLSDLFQLFNKTATEVCEGQQMDMDFELRNDVLISEYLEMIRLKTSVLIGCSLEMGAIIGGASNEQRALLYRFGEQIGIAFQLQDDILDLFGETDSVGKQIGGDIVANKKTFLLLRAIESANENQLIAINKMLAERDNDVKIQQAKSIFLECNVLSDTKELMLFYYSNAMEAISQLNLEQSKKEPFIELADFLIQRDK